MGMDFRVATPKEYEPQVKIVNTAKKYAKKSKGKILVTNDPKVAVKNADVIYTDVWVSMGQEKETKRRLKQFQGYQINKALCKFANKDYIFMHCLPAHRGEEVHANVIDSSCSIVFEQAENRMHAQKAVLLRLME